MFWKRKLLHQNVTVYNAAVSDHRLLDPAKLQRESGAWGWFATTAPLGGGGC